MSISGSASYSVSGTGDLAFYGPATSGLGASGNWASYSASVTGTISITLTTDSLVLNGQTLPAGTYTITTSAANFGGSGPSTSPTFSGTASINATSATVDLGPATGGLAVGGIPSLSLTNGATLTGYTGAIAVAANANNTDSVTLSGNTDNVLTVSASPAAVTADQNTPATFQTNLVTSLPDSYTITAHAPLGWTIAIDNNGIVTVTPAPGLQGGTFPIQIIAQSTTNPNLIAQGTVNVTVTPTQPGITFTVNPDSTFTVPFGGAEVPSAFQAVIHNNGPAADTFNLTFPPPPAGFTFLSSATQVTIPAGQTGIVGFYLQPVAGQALPPPGTQFTFDVTATSASNPAITQTQNVVFTVSAIDAVTITANPTQVTTTPNVAAADTITITNVGNVPENNIPLATTASTGLTVSGLPNSVSVGVGQSVTEPITLTPDVSTPLGSTLATTVTATYGPAGSTQTLTLQLPVEVAVPGADAIANAAQSASQLGNANLANRLNDLALALTNLVQNPTDSVAQGQALASLDAVTGLLGADPFLAPLLPALATDRAALAAATTASDVQAAVSAPGQRPRLGRHDALG